MEALEGSQMPAPLEDAEAPVPTRLSRSEKNGILHCSKIGRGAYQARGQARREMGDTDGALADMDKAVELQFAPRR